MSEEIKNNSGNNEPETKPTYSEEEFKALEKQIESMKNDYAKLKQSFDRTSSELSERKKKEKDNMDADERKTLELKELAQQNEQLKADIKKARFFQDMSATGLGEIEAEAMFTAFNEGDSTTLAKTLNEFIQAKTTSLAKELETLKLESMKAPDNTLGGNVLTKEAFNKMTLDERSALRISQPEVYAKLRGGN